MEINWFKVRAKIVEYATKTEDSIAENQQLLGAGVNYNYLVDKLVTVITAPDFLKEGNRNNSSVNFYILCNALGIEHHESLLNALGADMNSFAYYRSKRIEELDKKGYYDKWCNDGVLGLTYLIG